MPRDPPPSSQRRDQDRDRDRERDRNRDPDRRPKVSDSDRRRRRTTHRPTNSASLLLPRDSADLPESASESPSPTKHRRHREDTPTSGSPSPTKPPRSRQAGRSSRDGGGDNGGGSGGGSGGLLSAGSLAKLDKLNDTRGWDYDGKYVREVQERERRMEVERVKGKRKEKRRERTTDRDGGGYESGRGYESERPRRSRRGEARVDDSEREGGGTGGSGRGGGRGGSGGGGGRPAQERAKAGDTTGHESGRGHDSDRPRRPKRERVPEHNLDYERDRYDEKQARRQGGEEDAEEKIKRYLEEKEKRKRRKQENDQDERKEKRRKRRVISGPLLEEGGEDEVYEYKKEFRGGADGDDYEEKEFRRKRRKRICIIALIVIVVLAIIIPVAVLMSKKSSGDNVQSVAAANSNQPANKNLESISENDIPAAAKGTILDPFSWYDTTDFNVTYTEETVGGLPLIGLNSTWDDTVCANEKVPCLNDTFAYGKTPIRGVNVGGWLNIEPFITPSFFQHYSSRDGVIDEWTLLARIGSKGKATMEKHYSSFVNAQTFAEIREAGFDHVRIPFGYWAVKTYDGDPYVSQVSWRYLLRGVEYARQNGLRVNLDLHGAPGSQNGWNHSGRQGQINWLNGTDGDINAQRTLDIHKQLSTFFSQPRYQNVVTLYGIVNEPRMVALDRQKVITWTENAIKVIRDGGITAILVFGDGFMGLDNWQGKLQSDGRLLLDVHQYVIFNVDQIALTHTEKLQFACREWNLQSKRSMNRAAGFGPTMCGEWSQADTDCTENINNVGMGSRWEGNLNTGNASTSVLTPLCPAKSGCSCDQANAEPSQWSDAYKDFLLKFSQAQMESFEAGWGWFYWTWDTESAPQWSYKQGMAAGVLPKKAYERSFKCSDPLPDYGAMGLPENF
ncbi:hypothetical protein W97_07891 [Coniosporium apollinis CBS 100218]|uniref:glucan 1,3-beta-glucosidase n=1 Tax=Coniosporium apollinis (strain CBS 100218) TaxID=1168221 RepID=R7Z3H6_CONA1|nr:uncharacterized protein W97_07891 [Coniosporium apollinis CBS 100218]EON68633.1 hypothetical protein W97_07891 [Coniosporium apollinis CBS 100218]